jgi:hypothetical protein
MKDHDIPIACSLSNAELRKREASLFALFKSAVIATEELSDGYLFQLPGDSRSLTAVTELIAAERECCRFLAFELTMPPNLGPMTLRVTGPPGAKVFLSITIMGMQVLKLLRSKGTAITRASETDCVPETGAGANTDRA